MPDLTQRRQGAKTQILTEREGVCTDRSADGLVRKGDDQVEYKPRDAEDHDQCTNRQRPGKNPTPSLDSIPHHYCCRCSNCCICRAFALSIAFMNTGMLRSIIKTRKPLIQGMIRLDSYCRQPHSERN